MPGLTSFGGGGVGINYEMFSGGASPEAPKRMPHEKITLIGIALTLMLGVALWQFGDVAGRVN